MENQKKIWTVPKVSPFYFQHCPLDSFGHNLNRFCVISFQNLKSRFFAVFWGLILTLNICKSSKKLPMTPRFGRKLPLIFSIKVIKSQSRAKYHLKMRIFFWLEGQFDPPSWIGLKACSWNDLNESPCNIFLNIT